MKKFQLLILAAGMVGISAGGLQAERVKFSCPETIDPHTFKVNPKTINDNYYQVSGNIIKIEMETFINTVPQGIVRFISAVAQKSIKLSQNDYDLHSVTLKKQWVPPHGYGEPLCEYELLFEGLLFKNTGLDSMVLPIFNSHLQNCSFHEGVFECDKR